jgi:curved DNA-binding protein CbpA
MENLRRQLESELRNLEVGENEELTVKLVTKKFKKKALKVHSDKTGKEDDEEFKQLLQDYNKVKDALAELSSDVIEEEETKTDLQNFFEKHNLQRNFPKVGQYS